MRVFCCVAAATLLLSACVSFAEADEEKSLEPGSPAPELAIEKFFNVPAHLVDKYRIEALRGKVVVLFFWRVSSEVSLKVFPRVEKIHTEFKEKGVVVIGLCRDRLGEIERELKKRKFSYPMAADKGGATSKRRYFIKKIPTAVVIDPDGMVAWRGSVRNQYEALVAKVRELAETTYEFVRRITPFRPKETCAKLEPARKSCLKGKFRDAVSVCRRVLKQKDATETEKSDAQALLDEIVAYAGRALRSAETLKKHGRFIEAEALFGATAKAFYGLDESKKAREAYDHMRRDKRIRTEKEAEKMLLSARALEERGKMRDAAARMALILKKYPKTAAAAAAKRFFDENPEFAPKR